MTSAQKIESWVTEYDTGRILRWASPFRTSIPALTQEMEEILEKELAEYDKVKIRILLVGSYWDLSQWKKALIHVKVLRNIRAFDQWAEKVIIAINEAQNG